MNKTNCIVLSLSLIIVFGSSCYNARKTQVDEIVIETRKQQEKEMAELTKVEAAKTGKFNEGKINTSISDKISSTLNVNKKRIDSVKNEVDMLSKAPSNRKTFRKTFKKIIKSKIVYLQADNKLLEKRTLNYGMITDVLSNSDRQQFDLATFFGPGEFMIPAEKMDGAKKAFAPIVDSVIKFVNKYADIPKVATVVLTGYTDATGTASGSPLYYRLLNELKKSSASKEELNLALSKLRAEAISGVVNQILVAKYPKFTKLEQVTIELVQEGRGEEFPNADIKDYTTSDERRRIVLFFWGLLPK